MSRLALAGPPKTGTAYLVSADQWRSLMETAHLLRFPPTQSACAASPTPKPVAPKSKSWSTLSTA